MELKDSVTKENLLRAFAGESQARNRYTFAADACQEKKLQILEQIFTYTAGQEKEHAEIFYNHLKQGGCENITITANYPIDLPDQPLQLLELARQHEMDEFGDIYPAFAEKAQEEGFPEIARHFRQIAEIEKVHAERFERFAKFLRENKLLGKREAFRSYRHFLSVYIAEHFDCHESCVVAVGRTGQELVGPAERIGT